MSQNTLACSFSVTGTGLFPPSQRHLEPIMPTDVVVHDLQSLIVPLHVEIKSPLLALVQGVLDGLNSLTTEMAVCYACLFHAISLKQSCVKAVVLSGDDKAFRCASELTFTHRNDKSTLRDVFEHTSLENFP